MNTLTSRILVIALLVLAGLNLFLLWTIWNNPEFRNSEYLIEEAIRPGAPRGDREERSNDRSGREMNRPFQRDQQEMQRRAEQFLRQRFGLTDEQSRQFTQLRREHMRSAIETQGQINSLRQNLLLRVQDFAPSPNDVKDQQERLAQVDRAISELQKTEEYQELEQQLLELERRNLKHMVQLRALMNADQVKQFDVTMPRYLFRFQQGSGGPAGGPGVGPGGGGPDGRGPGGSHNRRPGS
jgi:hypothetical protein